MKKAKKATEPRSHEATKGKGRPVFGRESYTVYVPLRVTPRQRELLRKYAAAAGLSEAEFIRRALDEYVEKKAGRTKRGV